MINFIDTHNRRLTPSTCDAVIKYSREDGKTYYCPLYKEGWFCLNKFTLSKDGGLRLSPISVGPTLSPTNTFQLLRTGELELPYGGKLTLASEAEALKELRVATVINGVLKDLEDMYDADLHEFRL